MKILLVYPTPPKHVWPRGRFHSRWVPAGLSQIAAELLAAGHDVRTHLREKILTENGFDFEAADAVFERELRAFRPDLVGFSALTASVNEAARLADASRRVLGPEALLVAGGAHATALPFETLEGCSAFDAVVIGEGERTLVEVAGSGPSDRIAGLALRGSRGPYRTAPRARIRALDDLAPPAWHLFDMDWHTAPNRWMIRWLKRPTLNIRTSRGCPNICAFCAGHVTAGPGVRFHSADAVLDQLHRAVKDFEVTGILFEDETFAADRNRLFEICRRLRT